MDRGLWIFLIVAVMSWGTVWAVLMHPRGMRDEPNAGAGAAPASERPPPGFLPSGQAASRADEEILTTRGMVPATDDLRREIQAIGMHLADEKAVPSLVSVFPGRADRVSTGRLLNATIAGKELTTGFEGAAGAAGVGSFGAVTSKRGSPVVESGLEGASPSGATAVHKVEDGDTLPALAARYLGDASFWPILYEINRDRIPSPDLLPLGSTLIVDPARAARVKQAQPRSQPESTAMGTELPPLESVEIDRFTSSADAVTGP